MPSHEDSHRTKGLLRLTMACNERCPFCNVPVEDYPRPTPDDARIDAELAAFVASGERTLTLSGGEPTLLRTRLLRVTRAARAAGVPWVELQTNAVLVDEDYARALAEAGLTSAFVSFLSHEPPHHDALAGLPGAWARCLRGMDALAAAGIAVTLNPVVARATQALLPGYVDFVAERLPYVRSISLSAVQPHGRARAHLDALLPDYEALGPAVAAAQVRAAVHGIELLNPYCGLPACVGWAGALERSVEAVQARAGGWRPTPGLQNQGDKAYGPACAGCALRPACGGAWHAWWALRGGRGLQPPELVRAPWAPGPPLRFQAVARAGDAGAAAALAAATAPTRWWWAARLDREAAALPFTHLALDLHADALEAGTLRAARALDRPRWVRLTLGADALDLVGLARLLASLGPEQVHLAGEARWRPAARALAAALPDVPVEWEPEGAAPPTEVGAR